MHEFCFENNIRSSTLLDFSKTGDYSQKVQLHNYSIVVYGTDTIILTGGSLTSVNEKIKFCIASKGIPQGWVKPEKLLAYKRTKLPNLVLKRYNHSSFISGNFLFVVFGKLSENTYHSNKAEYLDLSDPDSEFKEVEIMNNVNSKYGPLNKFEDTMFFGWEPESKCEKIYFFGGQNNPAGNSYLYYMDIKWGKSKENKHYPEKLEIVLVLDEISQSPINF